MRAAFVLAALALGGCASSPATIATYQPATGSNEVLRGAIEAAPDHDLVVGDLVAPAGSPIPRHYHHGEEFIYVLGGSATVSRPGTADVTLRAGDSIRIAPGVVHWGMAGDEGVRAITSWVQPEGRPLRVPVPE